MNITRIDDSSAFINQYEYDNQWVRNELKIIKKKFVFFV